jgi:VanZ family protein
MLKPLRQPLFWLISFFIWFGVLWILSSRSNPTSDLPEIPNLDKFLHFGYFFGGGGLLSAYLFCRNPERPNWLRILLITAVVIGSVGILDEIHQTYTPNRSGNDPLDWLADILGAISGSLVFRRYHRALKTEQPASFPG